MSDRTSWTAGIFPIHAQTRHPLQRSILKILPHSLNAILLINAILPHFHVDFALHLPFSLH
ncbi:hypothetical protein [uncultured Victivallis sp.]|uniref:hypothetical protein n=1 Tax=uncultured Victivallis sp. TaxID=354118 RepID=UPI00259538B7|nr:hypothetical protein [uncultured Victivallis sp.]